MELDVKEKNYFISCNFTCNESHTTGGEEAVPGSWPWQVRIGFYNVLGVKAGFMCGGSIIDQRHILTAAHCFDQA